MFETLEDRRLMSVAPLGMSVNSDASGNLIIQVPKSSNVTVRESAGKVTILSGGVGYGSWLNIHAIRINAAGLDTINFTGTSMGAAITGSAGLDIINVTDPTAGTSASVIHAGGGKDTINIFNGKGTIVYGDSGTNTIIANAGSNFSIYGAFNDHVTFNAGVSNSVFHNPFGGQLKDYGIGDSMLPA